MRGVNYDFEVRNEAGKYTFNGVQYGGGKGILLSLLFYMFQKWFFQAVMRLFCCRKENNIMVDLYCSLTPV